MTKATRNDKHLVVEILSKAFANNQSVNYIIKQDHRTLQRIQSLMEYSFEYCYPYGEVFLSDDRNACALIMYPDKKKVTLKSLFLDLKLILTAVGFQNIKKTLGREAMINRIHPAELKYYIWFIGVHPAHQQQGIGSRLLKEILQHAKQQGRPLYLETSVLTNVTWYQQFGFSIYHEVDLGFQLFFMKKAVDVLRSDDMKAG